MTVDANELVKVVVDAAKPVVETLGDTWNAVVGDRVAAYRLRNAAKLQPKVEAELARLGLKMNPAKIPERYALAWFEEATKQDEPQIQDLFARLLAKAATGHVDSLDRRLLEIVSRLTPADATIFAFVYDKDLRGNPRRIEGKPLADFDMKEYDLFKVIKKEFEFREFRGQYTNFRDRPNTGEPPQSRQLASRARGEALNVPKRSMTRTGGS